MNTKEKKYSGKVKCRHCGNEAPMEIVSSYYDQKDLLTDENEPIGYQGDIYELLLCPACHNITLQSGFWHDAMDPDDWTAQILYPTETKQITGLPEAVKKAYNAALKVRLIDTNAFAVLLGRLLDIICQDRSAEGKSLYEKLKYLANKGEMPSRLAEMANGIRQLRNIGAHADLGELSDKEIPFLDGLCRAILEYIYSAPQLIEAVQSRLDKIVKT